MALRGPINARRRGFITQAFRILDNTGDGRVTLEDIQKVCVWWLLVFVFVLFLFSLSVAHALARLALSVCLSVFLFARRGEEGRKGVVCLCYPESVHLCVVVACAGHGAAGLVVVVVVAAAVVVVVSTTSWALLNTSNTTSTSTSRRWRSCV